MKNFLSYMSYLPRNRFTKLCVAALMSASCVAQAGEGHDHGEKPTAQASSLPRFVASSDQYELVGIIDGKKITAYLDNSMSNEPVKDAKLSLELGGKPVALESKGDGVFELTLVEPLKPGVTSVSATLSAGTVSDLLAGEIDIHEDRPKPKQTSGAAHMLLDYAPWIAGILAVFILIGVVLKRILGKRKARFA